MIFYHRYTVLFFIYLKSMMLISSRDEHGVELLDETWKTKAIKDIAFYLRNHKFNEWDRRFYRNKPNQNTFGFYAKFPEPSLRSLHWEVHENCYNDFYKCINYVHKIIEVAPFKRSDDTVTILNSNWSLEDPNLIKKLDQDCNGVLFYADKTGLPFDGPQERFIWRVSVSYFMCWYTMRGTADLSILGESCDNFASCLDPKYGKRNYDPRADDTKSFYCALHSFCPNPCCPLKRISSLKECINIPNNPCLSEKSNNSQDVLCMFDRTDNKIFDGIITNKWNVSCQKMEPT